MSIGNSSSLPANILKHNSSFSAGLKNAKFCVGPIISSPGPILFIVEATTVKEVIRSWSPKLISRVDAAKIII